MRNLTGVPIHYLITVNFRGFTKIVANLGGVWMDVDRRYFNDNSSGYDRYAAIDLKPGYQSSAARRRSTSCASATPTPTSTGSRDSSCS